MHGLKVAQGVQAGEANFNGGSEARRSRAAGPYSLLEASRAADSHKQLQGKHGGSIEFAFAHPTNVYRLALAFAPA